MSNLHNLAAVGQSIWIDSLSRGLLDSGALAAEIDTNAVTGVTSNPSIFAQAMLSGNDYDPQLEELVGRDATVDEIYTALVTQDIQQACDVMRPVFDRTGAADGFVSVEVSPELAADTGGTIAEARDWVKRVNRPNLLIKVPATREGIPAIEALIAEGISVNVTLIFSLDRYQAVMEAYIAGLEAFQRTGGKIATVASVASFFVSRVDSEVDARLDALGTSEATSLKGKAAVANARVAYLQFLQTFSTGRWLDLAVDGGRVQQPLVGVYFDKESGVSRHAVCRHACGADDRQHDAGVDNCRLSGSRTSISEGARHRRHERRGGRTSPPGRCRH